MTIDTQLKNLVLGRIPDAIVKQGSRQVYRHPRMNPPRAWVCDCLSLLRRIASSPLLEYPESPLLLYNVFARFIRAQITQNGIQRVYLVFDKGVHQDKVATANERKKAREQSVNATAAAADPKKGNACYDGKFMFAKGVMLGFEYSPQAEDHIVTSIEYKVNLAGVLNSREIRVQFLEWVLEMLTENSKTFPGAEFVVDWNADPQKGPVLIREGKAVLKPDWANKWHEADHAIGSWVLHYQRHLTTPTARHCVVWAVDGDILIVLLWLVYEQRRARGTHESKTENIGIDHPNRGFCADMRPFGSDEKTHELSLEPRVVFVWEAPRSEKTLVIDINEAVSQLINRGITPWTIAMTAMLTKNDYVKKEDITPGLGPVPIFEFLNTAAGKTVLRGFEESKYYPDDFREKVIPAMYSFAKKKSKGSRMDEERPGEFRQVYEAVVRALLRWKNCVTGGLGPE